MAVVFLISLVFGICLGPVTFAKDCRNSTKDFDYNGHIYVTRRGYNCRNNEYCRMSIADFNSSEGPWCYIDNENPYWDYCNVPVCESAKCPDLIVNPNLKSLDGKTTYRYGEIVILTCNTGYRLRGSWSLTCQQTGQWNNTIPQCQVVTCHDLRQVPHQKLEPVQKAYSYRDNVSFKCDNGYELSSADTMVTCQSDGTWSNKQPNCTDKSQSQKDSMENRGKCISNGLFGGILAATVFISAAIHIATCFYYRKRVRKSAAVYEDMQFNAAQRQRSSNEETYSELT